MALRFLIEKCVVLRSYRFLENSMRKILIRIFALVFVRSSSGLIRFFWPSSIQ